MKDLKDRDDIDRLIDGLLADPSRVREVKARLRRRDQVRTPQTVKPIHYDSQDPDEYWDNVPI